MAFAIDVAEEKFPPMVLLEDEWRDIQDYAFVSESKAVMALIGLSTIKRATPKETPESERHKLSLA